MILALWLFLAAPAPLIAADGQWAALGDGKQCRALSRSILAGPRDPAPAQAALSFASDGSRQGEFAARLSRPVRNGSSVTLYVGEQPFLLVARGVMAWSRGPDQDRAIMAAIRREGGMRLVARSPGGGRFTDRYLLDGAPTAIDAAAAACAPRRW